MEMKSPIDMVDKTVACVCPRRSTDEEVEYSLKKALTLGNEEI